MFPQGLAASLLIALCYAPSMVLGDQPTTISLQARKMPKGSGRVVRRALPPTSEPLDDFFLGTDLQWYGNLSVGTPPQILSVVFDTGSGPLEFASTRCGSNCDNQIRFNETKSSTFIDIGETADITFATGVGVDPVVGSNYQLQLRSASDTVSYGNLTVPNLGFYLITDQTPTFSIDPFSGIQGMGANAVGLFGGLVDQGLPALFSLYLTPKAVGNAEITLGGVDESKYTGNLTYISQFDNTSEYWALHSPGVFVNGKSTTILNQQRTIIFDSGTSNVLFSTETAEAIYSLISPDIKANPDEPGTYGIACDLIHTFPTSIDIQFTSQDGKPFNLTIPSTELSVGPFTKKPQLCQTLINAYDGLELIGASLFKHYYTVWDIENKRMGFAPAVGV